MSILWTLLFFVVVLVLVVPFIAVTVLRILMRKFSFKASVAGPKSFHSIVFRLPIKMNLQLVIRIQNVSLNFHMPKSLNEVFGVQGPSFPWLKISIQGLQINVLLRDDFKKWGNQKIELLEIITQMRQKLMAMGLLKTNLRSRIDEAANASPQQAFEAGQVKQNFDQTYRNLLQHFLIDATDTQCNFYVYKMDSLAPGTLHDCDTNNIRDFCTFYLSNQRFQQRFICFRLQAPSAQLRVKRVGEDNCDIGIEMKHLLLQNPNFKHKCGLLHQVELELKVPLDKKLLKNFCNFEVRIQVQDGILDLNKRFVQSFVNFFVYLDTLLTVIKGIRKLVLRQHYQDSLLYEMIRQNRKGQQIQPIFANYRDTAIPKRLQVIIQEGLQLYITDACKLVEPFLQKAKSDSEIFFCHFWKRTTFEVAATLKDSYYINFQCEEVKVDLNGKKAIRSTSFVQEMDLTFKREITTSPVKLSRLEVAQRIDFKTMAIEMSPSMFNVLHEIANYYLKSKNTASVKHVILGQISDRNFLLTNIIATSNNTEIRLSDEQILEIYENIKHQDRLSTTVAIGYLSMRHDSSEIYSQHQTITPEQRNSVLEASIVNMKCSYLIAQGTEKQTFDCSQIQIGEVRKKKSRNQLPCIPFVSSLDFSWQKVLVLPTSKFNEDHSINRSVYIKTDAKKFQVGVNFEFIMDFTNDILDYAFVTKAFSQKWQKKYNTKAMLREAYQNAVTSAIIQPFASVQTITKLNTFYFAELVFTWNLSCKRLICLSLQDLRPFGQPIGSYETFKGHDLHYLVLNGNFANIASYKDQQQTLRISYCSSHGQWIHRYVGLNSDQTIIESKGLELHLTSSEQHVDVQYNFLKTEANLPHDYHHTAGINEIMKQVTHISQWFKQQFTQKQDALSYTFKYSGQKTTEAQRKLPRSLKMAWNFQKGVISFEEDPIKHIFVAKNDISETIKERDILRLKPKSTMNLLQKIKSSGIYGKSLFIQLEEYSFSYEKPADYLNQDFVFAKIQQLDEADQFLTRSLFQELKGARHKQKVSYMAWHGRSFFKPVFEIWGFDFQFDNFTGIQNSHFNPQLFSQMIEKRIFQKFSLPVVYNRLPNKMFYESKLDIQNLQFSVQGQQTFLFMNDLGGAVQRVMSFEDQSRSLDPTRSLLPYFQGVDRLRHRNHGQLKVNVKNTTVEIWPKRRLGRYVDKLVLRFYDLEYGHKSLVEKERKTHQGQPVVLQHLLCLRNLSLQKDPIKQFESVLLNLPLLEVHLYNNYNQGTTMNHYLHQKAQNLAEYLQHLDDYAVKDFFIELKLNLPSFGTINTTKQKSLFLPQLMQSYVANSPVPIFNYQRSYLKIIDETLREYVNGGKRDISGRVLNKFKQRKFSNTLLPENKFFQLSLKINAFIGDIQVLFTDFEEDRDSFSNISLDNQVLEPEQMDDDSRRNEYLSRYQGIVFSLENLCLQSLVEISRNVKERSFKSLKSYFRCNFFKIAAINSKNLYNIRHGQFLENQNGFLDNYRVFMNFFEIDKPSFLKKGDLNYETLLNGFKTLFPDYVLHNEQIQHQINEAQGAYETADDYMNNESGFQQNEPSSIEEYFNFRDDDTIGIISKASYTQNKVIKWENQNYSNQSREKDEIITPTEPQPVIEEIQVRHMFEIENMRMLYTSKINDLFTHHLLKGFDFKQFRKNDYLDLENRHNKQKDFLKEYRQNERSQTDFESESNLALKKQSSQIEKYLQKEAFFALVLKDHQISCQNAVTKSQLLFALNSTTTLLVHAYRLNPHYNRKLSSQRKYQVSMMGIVSKDVVKYGLSVNVKSTELFVSPLLSNLEQQTFWASEINKTSEQNSQELLRKIVSIQDCLIKVQLLNELLIDNQQPKQAIELLVSKLSGEMDGPNMWHAYSVIQMILLSRGEKSSELIFIEEAKKRDLDALGRGLLNNMIDKELKKSQFNIGVDSIRPNLARKVEYSVQTIEFTLFNNNQKFTSGLIENLQGKHMIYQNRESKTDIDIDRITLFNHCDTEEYRMVLYPSNTWPNNYQRFQSNQLEPEPAPVTMIKIRSRDKFVIVREAPWRVYDQLEYYIHPTSVQLTQQFYQQLKIFFFENNPLSNIKSTAKGKKFTMFTTKSILSMVTPKKKSVADIGRKSVVDSQVEMTIETTLNSARQSQAGKIFEQSNTEANDETQMKQFDFPSFFRYMRINEIKVQISYYHAQHHLLNIRDFKLKIPPYISHGAFAPFKKALENYEYHCKKNFISQIPNLLMRKAAQVKEQVKNFKADEPVEEQRSNETKLEMKMAYAKKILHGDFAI